MSLRLTVEQYRRIAQGAAAYTDPKERMAYWKDVKDALLRNASVDGAVIDIALDDLLKAFAGEAPIDQPNTKEQTDENQTP
jgi:hypothetical protein